MVLARRELPRKRQATLDAAHSASDYRTLCLDAYTVLCHVALFRRRDIRSNVELVARAEAILERVTPSRWRPTVDQQLCRWLLLSLDRLQTNELSMTQELIANMLGVRREGVTEAAGKLQNAGLISYQRGRITVLDRPGLEARSCECYQVVKTEFDRLLPYVVT